MPLLVIVYEAPLGSDKVFTFFVCYSRAPFQSVGLIVAYSFDREEILHEKFPMLALNEQYPNKVRGILDQPEVADEISKPRLRSVIIL